MTWCQDSSENFYAQLSVEIFLMIVEDEYYIPANLKRTY